MPPVIYGSLTYKRFLKLPFFFSSYYFMRLDFEGDSLLFGRIRLVMESVGYSAFFTSRSRPVSKVSFELNLVLRGGGTTLLATMTSKESYLDLLL